MKCAEALAAARRVSVLVVGDICLDRWCRYEPALGEASRETGISRRAVTDTTVSPGAGGTVAANLAALGARRVSVLGVIGRDGFGHELRGALRERGIETDLLIDSDAIQTFTYTKLINAETGVEDLPRVDFVNTGPLADNIEREIAERFSARLPDFDAVVVCDQAETARGGVVTPLLREILCRASYRYQDKAFVADSRTRIQLFRGVIATPNEFEARQACLQEFGEVDYRRLQRKIGAGALVVTAGARGAWLVDRCGQRLIATRPQSEPVDTCGAGDSLSAGLAIALAAGADLESAVRFGMIVAGVTVGKPGTGSASPGEVQAMADLMERRG